MARRAGRRAGRRAPRGGRGTAPVNSGNVGQQYTQAERDEWLKWDNEGQPSNWLPTICIGMGAGFCMEPPWRRFRSQFYKKGGRTGRRMATGGRTRPVRSRGRQMARGGTGNFGGNGQMTEPIDCGNSSSWPPGADSSCGSMCPCGTTPTRFRNKFYEGHTCQCIGGQQQHLKRGGKPGRSRRGGKPTPRRKMAHGGTHRKPPPTAGGHNPMDEGRRANLVSPTWIMDNLATGGAWKKGGRTKPVQRRGRRGCRMQAGGAVNNGCTMWTSQVDCQQNGCHWNFDGPTCH